MSFIKRHKFLSIVFVVCIFLMIKISSIPYLFTPPSFVSLLFDKPRTEFFLGVAQIVDIFASAYVTSLLFYYMVDFLPTVKKEEKAKEIVNTKLVSIYLYISQFLAMIEYAAKQEDLLPTSTTKSLNDLAFRNKIIYCKQTTLKNGVENGTIPYSYNLLKDCDKYRKIILDACGSLSGIPSFSFCDINVVNIISEIQLLDVLQTLPSVNAATLNPQVDSYCMSLNKDYERFLVLKEKLGKLIDVKWDYKMVEITPEEILKYQQNQDKMLSENAEIVEMLSKCDFNK